MATEAEQSNTHKHLSKEDRALKDAPRAKSQEPLWTADFILGTLTNFILSCNYFMLTVVMTEYALQVYHAPASIAAFTASIFIIGTLCARLASAVLLNKMSPKTLMLLGVLAEIVFTTLYIMEVPLFVLMGIRLVHGFAYGLCSTTMATIITTMIPPQRKGEGIGYYMLSVTLGAAIGPFAGILLSRNVSYNALFVTAAAIVIISIPLTAFIRESKLKKSQPENAKGAQRAAAALDRAEEEVASDLVGSPKEAKREQLAAAMVKRKSAHPNGSAQAGAAASADDRKARGPIEKFIELGALPISLVCCLIFFGYSSLLTFLTPYAIDIGLARAASVFFIVYAISMFITRPFTGRAYDRHGPLPVMVPSFVSFSAGMLVLAFAGNDWMILGSGLLLGFGVGTIQSCGLAMAVDKTPLNRLSVTNATFYMMLDVGVGIGPLLLGLMVPAIGYVWMYICMAGVGLIGLVYFFIVVKTKK